MAKRQRRAFGKLKQLPSGNWRASYTGPDGMRHSAPSTFKSKVNGEGWLANESRSIDLGTWKPPSSLSAEGGPMRFGEYAQTWLKQRTLKPTTRGHYTKLLERQIGPTFDAVALKDITPARVKAWHARQGSDTPTLTSHAYGLLRTILGDAVHDGELIANPCHIRGAGNAKKVHKTAPASLAELETITAAMPAKYQLMVLLSSWCALRFGELTELRRSDIDLKTGTIRVRRGVSRAGGTFIVGTPKTSAGIRDVAIPPHLLPAVKAHLGDNITGGRDGLLFPAGDGVTHLAPSTLYKVFYPAREAAGRPDLRWHDLRHTGAVLAAQTGATLAELMGRLGHSTPGAAMRYQHAAKDRDTQIAAALSAMVEASK